MISYMVMIVCCRISKIPLRDRLTSWNCFLKVYVLTSFIDAHEESQASFVKTLSGVNIDSEENMMPEQQKVLNESKESVKMCTVFVW